jgi:hypothetical protein
MRVLAVVLYFGVKKYVKNTKIFEIEQTLSKNAVRTSPGKLREPNSKGHPA